ncbi:iron-containing alcohol dehydrogenase [Micromonospora chalcea]|uniref:iron-containing alcohol dehydrogenase family protein n=1 Tax=Micromonospora chalcea TaxID=1874 RepID=UPI0033DE972D
MTIEFAFGVPTRLAFGPGSVDGLAAAVAEAGSRALVITGHASSRGSGLLDRCTHALRETGVQSTVYDGIDSNPTYESILAAAESGRAAGAEAIVAIGGGSAMDAGRLTALAMADPQRFWECRVSGSLSVPGIPAGLTPTFTVPTLHGTGAEISPAALVRRGTAKEVFFSPHLFPRAAFVEPSLALTASAKLTAEAGVDALIQGLEAYVSRRAQPFSDMFALEAIRLAARWLPAAVRDPADPEAREFVALAALLSLYAVNQAGVGGIHALSNPLSGRYNLHHGRALSLVAVAVVEYNLASSPDRFATVARLLDGADAGEPARSLGDWLVGLGLGGRLSDHGARPDDLDAMAVEAQNPDMATNPQALPPEAVRRIYRSLM